MAIIDSPYLTQVMAPASTTVDISKFHPYGDVSVP